MCLYFLPLTHRYARNIGVDGKIVTMADNNGRFIPFNYEYTGHFALEDGTGACALGYL